MNLVEKTQAFSLDLTPKDSSGTVDIGTIMDKILPVLGILAAGIAVIFLIYSGILYLTAAGNAENAKKGQQGIINAIIGIVIIAAAYIIVRVVFNTSSDAVK